MVLNWGRNGDDTGLMAGPTEPTRTARRFRVVVALGSTALSISVFLPWCRIWGYKYTFFGVDHWKALPVAEIVIAAGGVVVAMIRLVWIKRIAPFVGGSAFALNMVGLFVGARLANVHNADPYFRIWAAISVWPEPGLWVAWLASAVLIVGGLSRWSVSTAVRDHAPSTARPLAHTTTDRDEMYGIPMQPRAHNKAF